MYEAMEIVILMIRMQWRIDWMVDDAFLQGYPYGGEIVLMGNGPNSWVRWGITDYPAPVEKASV